MIYLAFGHTFVRVARGLYLILLDVKPLSICNAAKGFISELSKLIRQSLYRNAHIDHVVEKHKTDGSFF
jgi:hypothetical protein